MEKNLKSLAPQPTEEAKPVGVRLWVSHAMDEEKMMATLVCLNLDPAKIVKMERADTCVFLTVVPEAVESFLAASNQIDSEGRKLKISRANEPRKPKAKATEPKPKAKAAPTTQRPVTISRPMSPRRHSQAKLGFVQANAKSIIPRFKRETIVWYMENDVRVDVLIDTMIAVLEGDGDMLVKQDVRRHEAYAAVINFREALRQFDYREPAPKVANKQVPMPGSQSVPTVGMTVTAPTEAPQLEALPGGKAQAS